MTTPPPITAALVTDDWISAVRDAAQRGGWPMRPHPTMPAIEFKNPNHNYWMVKQLPGGGICFTSEVERDAVMRRLEGR